MVPRPIAIHEAVGEDWHVTFNNVDVDGLPVNGYRREAHTEQRGQSWLMNLARKTVVFTSGAAEAALGFIGAAIMKSVHVGALHEPAGRTGRAPREACQPPPLLWPKPAGSHDVQQALFTRLQPARLPPKSVPQELPVDAIPELLVNPVSVPVMCLGQAVKQQPIIMPSGLQSEHLHDSPGWNTKDMNLLPERLDDKRAGPRGTDAQQMCHRSGHWSIHVGPARPPVRLRDEFPCPVPGSHHALAAPGHVPELHEQRLERRIVVYHPWVELAETFTTKRKLSGERRASTTNARGRCTDAPGISKGSWRKPDNLGPVGLLGEGAAAGNLLGEATNLPQPILPRRRAALERRPFWTGRRRRGPPAEKSIPSISPSSFGTIPKSDIAFMSLSLRRRLETMQADLWAATLFRSTDRTQLNTRRDIHACSTATASISPVVVTTPSST